MLPSWPDHSAFSPWYSLFTWLNKGLDWILLIHRWIALKINSWFAIESGELHHVWKEKEYYKKWCYDESSGLRRPCTHFSHIFFTILTDEENVTDPTCWQVMTDFTVLFLQCVVCNGMTNTAHYTHIPSTNNQSLDSQKLKSHQVKCFI